MTASALADAQMQWYLADPRISEEHAPLLASAFSVESTEEQRKYATTRLSSTRDGAQALEAITAAFSGDGNSYINRRMRAMRQLRNRLGQFAYQGGGARVPVRTKDGSKRWLTGTVVGATASSNTYDIQTPKGIVRVPASSVENVEAYLPGKTKDGYSPVPARLSAADESDIIDEADLEFVDSPAGWVPVDNFQGNPGEKAFSDGVYTVAQTDNEDGSKSYRLIDENGDEVAKGDSWASMLDESAKDAIGGAEPSQEITEDMLLEGLDEIANNETAGAMRNVAQNIAAFLRDGTAPSDRTPEQLAEQAENIANVLANDADARPNQVTFGKKFQGFEDDFRKGAEAITKKLGGQEIQQDKKEEKQQPIAKLPKETAPALEVPQGAYELEQGDYTPSGRVTEDSTDFTDDPETLATKFKPREIANALQEALIGDSLDRINGLGYGGLEFNEGVEEVPAEALYFALKKQGKNADKFVADTYEKGKARLDRAQEPEAEIEEPSVVETPEAKPIAEIRGEDVADALDRIKDIPEVSEITPAKGKQPIEDVNTAEEESEEEDPNHPALIEGLTEDELQSWVDSGFDHVPFLPSNEDIKFPESYTQIDPNPVALEDILTVEEGDALNQEGIPVGWTDDPYVLAQDFPSEDLIDSLEFALEPRDEGSKYSAGKAPFSYTDENGDEFVMEIAPEYIRDALQLQGEDTNEILQEIADRAWAAQADNKPVASDVEEGRSSGDLTDEEMQAMMDGEGIAEEPSVTEVIAERARGIQPGGGLTIDTLDGSEPTEGFVVARQGFNKEINFDEFMSDPEKYIYDYLAENKDALSEDNMYLGFWHDEENNEMVLDVSEVFSDREAGIQAGIDRNQQAIYDIGSNEVVNTGGTGDREEATESQPSEGTEETQPDDGRGTEGIREGSGTSAEEEATGPVSPAGTPLSVKQSNLPLNELEFGDYIDPSQFDVDVPNGSHSWYMGFTPRDEEIIEDTDENGVTTSSITGYITGFDAYGNEIDRTVVVDVSSDAQKFTTFNPSSYKNPNAETKVTDSPEDIWGLNTESNLPSKASIVKFSAPVTDMQPGDVTIGDNFTITEVGTEPDSRGKISVKGYFPGHPIQEKLWKNTTPINFVRGIPAEDMPMSGNLPEIHKPRYADFQGGSNSQEFKLAYAKWRGMINAARGRWTNRYDVASYEFNPTTDIHRVKVHTNELKPGDVMADATKGNFVIVSVSDPNPDNPDHADAINQGLLIVKGYYPGHELQEKQWKPRQEGRNGREYKMEVIRNSELPESGPLPAINQGEVIDGRYVRNTDPEFLKQYNQNLATAASLYNFPSDAPEVDYPQEVNPALREAPRPVPEREPRSPFEVSDPFAQGAFAEMLREAGSWENLREAMKGMTFTFFDYETTGLDPNTENPVQLGAVKIKDGVVVDRFNMYMNPGRPLEGWSKDNLKDGDGNPLSDEFLQQQASMAEAHQAFADWVGADTILGAQNSRFDRGFLESALSNTGVDFTPTGYIDPQSLARAINADAGNPRKGVALGKLAEEYGVSLENWHSADADAEAAALIFGKLLDRAQAENLANGQFDVDAIAAKHAEDLAFYDSVTYPNYLRDLEAWNMAQAVANALAGNDVDVDQLVSDAKNTTENITPESAEDVAGVKASKDLASKPTRLGKTEWVLNDANTRPIDREDVRANSLEVGDFMRTRKGDRWSQVVGVEEVEDNRFSIHRIDLESGEEFVSGPYWGGTRLDNVRRPISANSLSTGEEGDPTLTDVVEPSEKPAPRLEHTADNIDDFNAETTVEDNGDGTLTATTKVFDENGDLVGEQENIVDSVDEAQTIGDSVLRALHEDIIALSLEMFNAEKDTKPTEEEKPSQILDVTYPTQRSEAIVYDKDGVAYKITVMQMPKRFGGGYEVGVFKDKGLSNWEEAQERFLGEGVNIANFQRFETLEDAKSATEEINKFLQPAVKTPKKPARSKQQNLEAKRARIQNGAYLIYQSVDGEGSYVWRNPDESTVPLDMSDPEQAGDLSIGRVFGAQGERVVESPEDVTTELLNKDLSDLNDDDQEGTEEPVVFEPGTPVDGNVILEGGTIIAPQRVVGPDGREYDVATILLPRIDGAPERYEVVAVDPNNPNRRAKASSAATLGEAKALHADMINGLADGSTQADYNFDANTDVRAVTPGDSSPYTTDESMMSGTPAMRRRIIGNKIFRKWQARNNIYADGVNQARVGDRVVHSYDGWNSRGEGTVVGWHVVENDGDIPREGYAIVAFRDGSYALWATRMLFLNGRTAGMENRTDYEPPKELETRPNLDPMRREQYALTNKYIVKRSYRNQDGTYQVKIYPYISKRQGAQVGETRRAYRMWGEILDQINEYRRQNGLPVLAQSDLPLVIPDVDSRDGRGRTWIRMMGGTPPTPPTPPAGPSGDNNDGGGTPPVTPPSTPTPESTLTPTDALYNESQLSPEVYQNLMGYYDKGGRDLRAGNTALTDVGDLVYIFDTVGQRNVGEFKPDGSVDWFSNTARARHGRDFLDALRSVDAVPAGSIPPPPPPTSGPIQEESAEQPTPTLAPTNPEQERATELADFVDNFNSLTSGNSENGIRAKMAEISRLAGNDTLLIIDDRNGSLAVRIKWDEDAQGYSVARGGLDEVGYFADLDAAGLEAVSRLEGARPFRQTTSEPAQTTATTPTVRRATARNPYPLQPRADREITPEELENIRAEFATRAGNLISATPFEVSIREDNNSISIKIPLTGYEGVMTHSLGRGGWTINRVSDDGRLINGASKPKTNDAIDQLVTKASDSVNQYQITRFGSSRRQLGDLIRSLPDYNSSEYRSFTKDSAGPNDTWEASFQHKPKGYVNGYKVDVSISLDGESSASVSVVKPNGESDVYELTPSSNYDQLVDSIRDKVSELVSQNNEETLAAKQARATAKAGEIQESFENLELTPNRVPLARRFLNRLMGEILPVQQLEFDGSMEGVSDINFDRIDDNPVLTPNGDFVDQQYFQDKGWEAQKAAQIARAGTSRPSIAEVARISREGTERELNEAFKLILGAGNMFGPALKVQSVTADGRVRETGASSIYAFVTIKDTTTGKTYNARRTFNFVDGKLDNVYNASMFIEGATPSGFSSLFNQFAENYYIANGAKFITVTAAGGGDATGAYVWAITGFNWASASVGYDRLKKMYDEIQRDGSRYVSGSADKARSRADMEAYVQQAFDAYGVSSWEELRQAAVMDVHPSFPTPRELAMVGWDPNARKTQLKWFGKSYMIANQWNGKKVLDPNATERKQNHAYDAMKDAVDVLSSTGETSFENNENIKRHFTNRETYQGDGEIIAPYADELTLLVGYDGSRSVSLLSPPAKAALGKYIATTLANQENLSLTNEDTPSGRAVDAGIISDLVNILSALQKDRLALEPNRESFSSQGESVLTLPSSIFNPLMPEGVAQEVMNPDTGEILPLTITKLVRQSSVSPTTGPSISGPYSGASNSWRVESNITGEVFYVKDASTNTAALAETSSNALGRALGIIGLPVIEKHSSDDRNLIITSELGTNLSIPALRTQELVVAPNDSPELDTAYLVKMSESRLFDIDETDVSSRVSVNNSLGMLILDAVIQNEDRNPQNVIMVRGNDVPNSSSHQNESESYIPIPFDNAASVAVQTALEQTSVGYQSPYDYLSRSFAQSNELGKQFYDRFGPVTLKALIDKIIDDAFDRLRAEYGPHIPQEILNMFVDRMGEIRNYSPDTWTEIYGQDQSKAWLKLKQ